MVRDMHAVRVYMREKCVQMRWVRRCAVKCNAHEVETRMQMCSTHLCAYPPARARVCMCVRVCMRARACGRLMFALAHAHIRLRIMHIYAMTVQMNGRI